MEWTNQMVLEFVDLYKEEEHVWNPNHADHKNKVKLNAAWENIQRKFGRDVNIMELKRKKEGLLSTYRTLYSKVVQSKNRGEIYKPTWFCFDRIHAFLQDIYKPRCSMDVQDDNSVDAESKMSEIYAYVEHQYQEQLKQQENLQQHQHQHQQQQQQQMESNPTNSTIKNSFKQIHSRKKHQKRKYENSKDYELRFNIKEAYDLIKEILHTPKEQKDDLEIYGTLVASKLRKLNPRRRAIMCNKIDNLLFDAEIAELSPF